MKRLLSALFVGVALTGCGDDVLSPEDADLVLALVSVSQEPLPARVDEGVATRVYVADTIWVFAEDWSRRRVTSREHPDGRVEDFDTREDGFISRNGSILVLDFECNDVIINPATCIAPAQLEFRDGGWNTSDGGDPTDSFAPLLRFEELSNE